MVRFWIAVASALIATTAATAGPIQWSYSSTFAPIVTPAVTPGYEGMVNTATTIHDELGSTPYGVATRGAWGWQTVNIASLVPDTGVSPEKFIAQEFKLNVSITDAASGQTGTVSLTGSANETLGFLQVRTWDGVLEDDARYIVSRHVTSFALSQLSDDTLTLGGNEYHVQVEQRYGANGTGYLDAAVTVGDVNLTPEPSTMVAAGVGLLGVAGVRLRRRR